MIVTEVKIRRVSNSGRMRAIASVTFDDQFVVHDLRVIEGNNGLFVAMPSRKTPGGDFKDIAHPISAEMRAYIHKMVMEAYESAPEE